MIKVHHLNSSRSHRILWMLEELELPYEIVAYQRDPVTRLAPPSLKAIHPLGKSPVITDGDRVVAESGAIIEYLAKGPGGGRLWPRDGSANWVEHAHWMHFAEGSAMLPLMLGMIISSVISGRCFLIASVMVRRSKGLPKSILRPWASRSLMARSKPS